MATFSFLWWSCDPHSPGDVSKRFSFAVLDVGQGLSQIGVVDGRAVVWDMGPAANYDTWTDGYTALGSPAISAIVISHAHEDHYGGLSRLALNSSYSGRVVVSALEDTLALRSLLGNWGARVVFQVVHVGETLVDLPGVEITCLWPPDSADITSELWNELRKDINRTSLCFSVIHGATSVLLTGDIDTLVEARLAREYGSGLASDAIVVPHHGSETSLSLEFYGYVVPRDAIISYGAHNTYGHPSTAVTQFIETRIGANVYETALHGSVVGESNGEYWAWSLPDLSL